MRGFWLSVVLWLLLLLALVAAFAAYFHYQHRMALLEIVRASLAGASMVFIGLYFLAAAARSWSDRAALRRGLSGAAPVDGGKSVLVGTLQARSGERVVSPLDGSSCLAYQYRVTGIVGSGRRKREVSYYRGSAIAPSTVATVSGSHDLLAVPNFEGEAAMVYPQVARERFRRYVEKIPFRSFKDLRAELDRWADADGSHRIDVFFEGESAGDGLPEIETASFHQQLLLPGDAVCVIGHYAAGRGIVPHPGGMRQARILAGDGGAVARTYSTQIRNYLLMAFLFVAAAAWLVVLAVPD